MNKIKEILCNNFGIDPVNYYDNENGIASAIECIYHKTNDPVRIEDAMREYAKYYAKRCLEIAAKNAVIKAYIKPNLKGKRYRELLDGESYNPMETTQMYKIDKKSIINIPLPLHD